MKSWWTIALFLWIAPSAYAPPPVPELTPVVVAQTSATGRLEIYEGKLIGYSIGSKNGSTYRYTVEVRVPGPEGRNVLMVWVVTEETWRLISDASKDGIQLSENKWAEVTKFYFNGIVVDGELFINGAEVEYRERRGAGVTRGSLPVLAEQRCRRWYHYFLNP